MRKIIYLLGILFLVACGLNFRWVHAAVVVAGSPGESCPQQMVDSAKERVQNLFDGTASAPWLLCLQKPKLGQGKTIGTTSFAPGLPAIIILNTSGTNVDVIAHEWAHAEFAARVGVIKRTYVLPTWFDEGLAMQVDNRSSYGLTALVELEANPDLTLPTTAHLATPAGFFQPGKQGVLHYAWSRRKVSRLLSQSSLNEVIERVERDRPD